MTNETVFLAIYKTQKQTVVIEYLPMNNGLIEIISVDIQARPVSPFEQREQSRRQKRNHERINLVTTPAA